jgi:RimJ/RimL family protein N-acetyltransferase
MNNIPGPAYLIKTQRLILRCWNPADAQLLKTAVDESLDHLLPWMPWAADEPEELQEKIDRLRQCRGKFDLGQDFVYGIFNLDQSRVLGSTGLHTHLGPLGREIGYWIHKDFINQGLATESSAALTRVAFEIEHIKRVEIHCDPDNGRSAAVPRKLGFIHEATLRQRVPCGEQKLGDTMIWTLFEADYPSSAAAKAQIEAFDVAGRRILQNNGIP